MRNLTISRGRRGLGLLATVGALLLTACGGSSGATGSNQGATKVSGTPVLLGSVLTIRNPAWSNANVQAVNDAWAQYVNSELGGIQGHPLQVRSCDDEGDPAKSRQCVQDLLDKGVVGFVNNSSLVFGGNSLPVMEGANEANMGGWPISPPEYRSQFVFPTTPGASGSYPSLAEYFVQAGAKKAVLVATNSPAGLAAGDATGKVWKALGGTSYKVIPFEATAPDYVPVMTQVANEKPDAVILLVGEGPAARMFKAAQLVGLKAMVGATSTAATKAVFDAAGTAADGIYFSMAVLPPTMTSNADVTLYKHVMKTYAPNVELTNQSGVAASSVAFAVKVLQSIKGPVTKSAVVDALRALKSQAKIDNFLSHTLVPSAAPSTMPQIWNPYNIVTLYRGGSFTLEGGNLKEGPNVSREKGATWFSGFTG